MKKEERDDYSIYDEDMAETMRNLEYEKDDEDDDYEEDEEDDYDDGCPLCGSIRCSGYCL